MAQFQIHVNRDIKSSTNQVVPHNFNDYTEAEIWMKFKSGDEAAFIWIYHTYFDKLFSFARQFGLDADLVKDQIQELFIYIRNSRKRLADVKSIKFYLFKSLRRRLLINKKKKFSIISIFNSDNQRDFEIEIIESPEFILIDQCLNDEIRQRITKSINKLTARQREAVLHFYYEGLSYLEITDIMDLKKVKSTRKLIYRAIEALRKDLKGVKSNLYK